MNKGLVIAIVIAALTLGYFAWGRDLWPSAPVDTTPETPVVEGTPLATTTAPTTDNEMVHKLNVVSKQLVRSPLTVTGEAKGPWYFEASFPIEVRDANGTIIGQSHAEAQGDWMTTGFVPFTSTVTFTTPTTTVGFLVLKKDNPSGDPARDQAVIIPIRFR
jgi:hypothetical protein